MCPPAVLASAAEVGCLRRGKHSTRFVDMVTRLSPKKLKATHSYYLNHIPATIRASYMPVNTTFEYFHQDCCAVRSTFQTKIN